MIAWLKKQNATVIGMLILCLLMIIGIILRWDYVKSEAGDSFKGLFQRADTIQTSTSLSPYEE